MFSLCYNILVFAVAALEFRAVNLFKATNLSEAKVLLYNFVVVYV